MIRLGLVGAGKWGQRVLTALKAHPNTKLTALCSSNPQASEWVDSRIYSDWRNLLQEETLDGLLITTPPETHYAITSAALEKSIPVFVEKPFTLSLKEAETLHALAEKKSIPTLVDHVHLFHPGYEWLKTHVHPREVVTIESEGCNWGPFRQTYSALWDYGSHDLAMILDFMGEEPQSFSAKYLDAPKRMEEGMAESVEFTVEFSENRKSRTQVGNLSRKKMRKFTVQTTSSQFVLDDTSPTPLTQDGQGIVLPAQKPLDRALSIFTNALTNKARDPRCGMELGVQVVRALENIQTNLNKS